MTQGARLCRRHCPFTPRWVLLFAALTVMVSITGCRLSYLFRVAGGQLKLLNGAIPVEEAMKNDTLSQHQKAHLSLVERVKEFAETELGLKKTSSYNTVNLEPDQPAIYVVSASPKDRFSPVTWWFPVIGHLPYLGFFDLESAQAEKKKLMDKDLDAFIGRAEAYSTLGWFSDPLTLNLIQGSTLDLVETVIHEMTHTTFYVKGQGEFNEGLAMLVGKEGARLFMEKTFGTSHPLAQEARKSIEDERLFCSFLSSLIEELNHLYSSPLAYQDKLVEREKVFALSLERFRLLRGQLKTQRFAHFERASLNNAFLVSVATYHRHYDLFERAWHRCGNSFTDMLQLLRNMARQEANMLITMQDWLDRAEVHRSPGPEVPSTVTLLPCDALGIS